MDRTELTASSGVTESQRTAYRVFGYSAIVHSILLLASLLFIQTHHYPYPAWLPYAECLWAGMVTLWFLWPIILALHAGISATRAYISLGIAALIFVLPSQTYLRFDGPRLFMPEELITFSPYDLVPYWSSYGLGWIDGKMHSSASPILLEGYGFGGKGTPGAPVFSDEALKKYGIQIQSIAACVVDARIQGHARGYNRASVAAIKRRSGSGVIIKAEQDQVARQKRWEDMHNAGMVAAQDDIRVQRLAVLICGPTREGENEYRDLLRARYQIELRRVLDADAKIDDDTWARVLGYNETISPEIRHRFGEEAEIAVLYVTSKVSFRDFLRKIEFDKKRRS